MRLGKVKSGVMDRSVRRQLQKGMEAADRMSVTGAAAVIQKTVAGEAAPLAAGAAGAAEGAAGVPVIGLHTVEGGLMAARRVVSGAAGKVLACGALPALMGFSILLPETAEEGGLKRLTGQIQAECSRWDAGIRECTVSVSKHVEELIVTACCQGIKSVKMQKQDQLQSGPVSWDLVVAGPVALEGTALIAEMKREELLKRYPAFFIEKAAGLFDGETYRVLMKLMGDRTVQWQDQLNQTNQTDQVDQIAACLTLGEGGIFAGLWEYASDAGSGLEVDLSRIPICQHTVEVCEFFNLNPYQLFSGGSMLMACANGGRLVRRLEAEGLEASVIGHTTGRRDRIIRYDEEVRYLERPKMDEYYLV